MFCLKQLVGKYSAPQNWKDVFQNLSPEEAAKRIFGNDFEVLNGNNLVEPLTRLLNTHKAFRPKSFYSTLRSRSAAIPPQSIRLFLFLVIDFVVPIKLVGCSKNKKHFKLFIGKLPDKSMYESIFFDYLVEKCDLDSIKWLNSVPEDKKVDIFRKFALWLIEVYIFKIILHNFYVCKSVNSGELSYFTKLTWKQIMYNAFMSLKAKQEIDVDRLTLLKNGITILYLRFLTKRNGLRPIMIKKAEPEKLPGEEKAYIIINKFLKKLFAKELSDSPFKRGYNFLDVWKEKLPLLKEKKHCFVKIDVKDAFGSVKHDVLEDVLKYLFSKYFTPNSMILIKSAVKDGKRNVFVDAFDDNFCSCPGVVELYSPEIILGIVMKSVRCQVFEWNKQLYRLQDGLAQGVMFSSVLCDLYMHAFSMQYLKRFMQHECLLFREVDDYLYITPSHHEALRFYDIFQKGFPVYGIQTNKIKSKFSTYEKNIRFWGYSIDPTTMEVKVDFSKYHDVDLTHKLNLLNNKAFCINRFVKLKALYSCVLPLRLVDGSINNFKTSVEILFMLMSLQAHRLRSLVRHYLRGLPREKVIFNTALMLSSRLNRCCRFTEYQCKYITLNGFYTAFRVWVEFQLPCDNFLTEIQDKVEDLSIIDEVIEDVIRRGELNFS